MDLFFRRAEIEGPKEEYYQLSPYENVPQGRGAAEEGGRSGLR